MVGVSDVVLPNGDASVIAEGCPEVVGRLNERGQHVFDPSEAFAEEDVGLNFELFGFDAQECGDVLAANFKLRGCGLWIGGESVAELAVGE